MKYSITIEPMYKFYIVRIMPRRFLAFYSGLYDVSGVSQVSCERAHLKRSIALGYSEALTVAVSRLSRRMND